MPPHSARHPAILRPLKKNERYPRLLGKRSLRVVLIVPFVLQLVGVVGLVGFLSFQNGQKAVNQLAAQLRREVSDRVNQHLDSYLSVPHQVAEQNATAMQQGFLDPQDVKGLGRFFWKQMKLFNTLGYISYGGVSGDYVGTGYYLARDRLQTDEVSPRLYGDKKDRTYDLDNQGNRIKLVQIIDYDFHTEDWYSAGIQANRPIWIGPGLWITNPDILSLSFCAPVYDRNNRLIGIVGVDQRLSQISTFLKQIQVSPSAKIFIFERDGAMIASSSTEPPYRLVKGTAERLKAIEHYWVHEAY